MKRHLCSILPAGVVLLVFFLSSCEKEPEMALISTNDVTTITIGTAVCGGSLTGTVTDGIYEMGILWDTYQYPNISENAGMLSPDETALTFDLKITGLKPNTRYYVRSYAKNAAGTAYGRVREFMTLNGAVDYDGNEYQFVVIGSQTWLKQNLRTKSLNDGTAIPYLSDITLPGYSTYDDNPANENFFGLLYNWAVVSTGKLCPQGFHVPSVAEWETLATYLGGPLVAGTKLKTVSGWAGNGNGTDETGFSALPGGYRINDLGFFSEIRDSGYWWTNADHRNRVITNVSPYLWDYMIGNPVSSSVRCIRN